MVVCLSVCMCVADSLAPGKGEKVKSKCVCFGVPGLPWWLSLALGEHTTYTYSSALG